MGRLLRALVGVALLLGLAVAAHQGLVVMAGDGERAGAVARLAAGTCAVCHGGLGTAGR